MGRELWRRMFRWCHDDDAADLDLARGLASLIGLGITSTANVEKILKPRFDGAPAGADAAPATSEADSENNRWAVEGGEGCAQLEEGHEPKQRRGRLRVRLERARHGIPLELFALAVLEWLRT